MSLLSFTLASTLRAGTMLTLTAGVFIAYEHVHTRALFERTVGAVMQAMNLQLAQHQAKTGCLTEPDDASVQGLTQAGLLTLDSNLPWTLSINYQINDHQVVANHVTFTASTERQSEQLKQLATMTNESWSYSGRDITLQRVVSAPTHEVMQQEYNPTTGCYAW